MLALLTSVLYPSACAIGRRGCHCETGGGRSRVSMMWCCRGGAFAPPPLPPSFPPPSLPSSTGNDNRRGFTGCCGLSMGASVLLLPIAFVGVCVSASSRSRGAFGPVLEYRVMFHRGLGGGGRGAGKGHWAVAEETTSGEARPIGVERNRAAAGSGRREHPGPRSAGSFASEACAGAMRACVDPLMRRSPSLGLEVCRARRRHRCFGVGRPGSQTPAGWDPVGRALDTHKHTHFDERIRRSCCYGGELQGEEGGDIVETGADLTPLPPTVFPPGRRFWVRGGGGGRRGQVRDDDRPRPVGKGSANHEDAG